MHKKIDIPATGALLCAVVFMGIVPLLLKYFTPYIDGWTANGIRYPVSALLYIPWLLIGWRRGVLTKRLWKLALNPTLINIVGEILWAWSPYFIDPGLMGFLVRLSTLWAVFGSFILFHDERPLARSKAFWLGFVFAASGFATLILGGNRTFTSSKIIGVAMIFFTSIFWAGYQLSVRRNLHSVDSRTAFGMVSCLTSLGLLGFMFSFGRPEQAIHMPLTVFLLVVFSGLIGVAASHLFLYFAIKRIGVAISSTVSLGSAFLTAFLSRLFYHESLTGLQWTAGFVLIFGGILLIRAQMDLKKS